MAYQYNKSIYRPKFPTKYLGNVENIVCRSGWERSFCKYCDETTGVLRWASEEFFVPYTSPVDGRAHRYFPDFFIEVSAASGGTKQFVIEIKPKVQSLPPKPRTRKTRKYLTEVSTFAVNQAKWEAATKFCAQKNWTFLVLTEEHLFRNFR